MLSAIVILTSFGIIAGAGLALASKKFYVYKDPRITKVLENLPGANCGACGFPGCAAMAEAIVAGKAKPANCPSITPELIKIVSDIMGIEVEDVNEKQVPRLLCQGGSSVTKDNAYYDGPKNCKIMSALSRGGKSCKYGCLGGGSCAEVCPVGAISMSGDGLPIIDEDKCISCGACAKECPKHVLKMQPMSQIVVVACSSLDKGPQVRQACSKGCIGCKICEKACPVEAIHVQNFLAVIDYEKCIYCNSCVVSCPTKAIADLERKPRG